MYRYPTGASARDYALIPSGMYYATRRTPTGVVLGIVLHVTAGLQDLGMVGVDDSAEATNRWGATRNRGKSSWHCCVDTDSIAPALPDTYTAWHVVGYNGPTWGLEISNLDARWDNKPDAWVEATLRNAAAAAAPIVKKYDLPLRLATRAEVDRALAAGKPFGFSYHMWLNPETRRDPGSTFPWHRFITYVRDELAGAAAAPKEDDMQPNDELWLTDNQKREWGVERMTVRDALLQGVYGKWSAGRAARDAAASLEVVKAMAAAGRPLTAAEVEAAAERGARKALQDEIDNATVNLNVTHPGGTP